MSWSRPSATTLPGHRARDTGGIHDKALHKLIQDDLGLANSIKDALDDLIEALQTARHETAKLMEEAV